jgi:hypothetical protein
MPTIAAAYRAGIVRKHKNIQGFCGLAICTKQV